MQPVVPINIPLRDEVQEVAAIHPLLFWTEYHEILASKPGEPEKWERKSYEWVRWAKKGVSIPCTSEDKIVRVRRDPAMWRAIQPHYDNWKAGGTDELINGTPLNAWGGITRDEVEALKPMRIYSVEDFASMPDGVMQRVPFPNISAKRERAKKWLATRETADELRGHLADTLAEVEKMKEEIAAMRTAQEAKTKLAELRGEEPPEEKPTRAKRKASAEAQA